MKTLCIIMGFLSLASGARASLDLHAHLDLKPGMGPLLQGSFAEPPRAQSWNSRLKTKASSFSLLKNESSPRLIVASFYAHPWLSDLKKALDLEYEHLTEFVKAHPLEWTIAKQPSEARDAFKKGLSVFVLSIEGADQVLETEADFKTWIDERGVAIVTPFHLTEDHLGGVALLRNGIAFFNSPIRFFESLLLSGGACLKTFCQSPISIKPDGEILIQNLMKRHVWIDLAHANELEVSNLLLLFEEKKLPLLVTHSQIRDTYPAERGVSDLEINYLLKHDGMIGLLPSDDMLNEPMPGEKKGACTSGLARFKETFQLTRERVGRLKVALGSDVNAPITGLSPLCEPVSGRAPNELERLGYHTYAQWGELSDYVSEDPKWNTEIIEKFLGLWGELKVGK